ncbi:MULTISPECIES: 4-hydroxy-tetrahydrodipicolinate synthase [unclassified Clostridioides]|uniref:4-hydroxy-tetrahydrodipicolinate synthase n=1 Tax=unclassified Clostridioides TaxID=2635829 RepID=UPI001D11A9E9|nr:4-hydroxy-tetrahydrodipicolinate synthase [Clostridioides sp. ES-S-0171-01]MCC0688450.1 4-hydroxy-tetrahydrodipicolinate synthase [Clostridioides sp. ES-S-0056-01]MCC0715958.1 4-hydroxy-tetrahydrodipicolinate synthase [Clostridioides sp. ES-S-0077-01]UDN56455.1 4-hydroxy-tetrahydrodipicolinate synthase [Clostridioides sp. ES-S-0054-01]
MRYKGIICAMITPFDENQNINPRATCDLIDHLINKGIYGLFILGTNGECHVMTDDEKVEFAKIVIDYTNNRVPVFVGTGGNSTREVINLSKRMEKIGASALSIITPYFVTPTQQELILHYKTIANSVNLPIMMYNMPSKTGINIEPNSVCELAKIKNIVGIKDSSGKLDNMKAYIEVTKGEDFSVFSGSDSLILDSLKAGGKGAVAATANFLTEIDIAIYDNFINGDLEEAQKAQNSIEELRRILKLGTIPSVIKKAVVLNGINVGTARLPVTEPTGEVLEEIKQVVENYKSILNKDLGE